MVLSISEKLGYIGLVPFVIGAIAVVFGVTGAEGFFKLYSLLVLSFMAGGCWGVEQANPDQLDEIPMWLSVGTFLWGILAYLLPTNISVLMYLVGFCLLLWTETNPIFRRVYTESYKRMRNILTGVVAALHIVVFIVVN